MEKNFDLMALTAFGIESVTKLELQKLGYETKVEDGRVNFAGDFEDIVHANLWLRTANRVMIKVGDFDASDFGTLFDKTFKIDWSDFLTIDAKFPVEVSSVKSTLSSEPACQSIIKKAIVEKLKTRYHVQKFSEDGALYRIKVYILKDHVTIGIDTTGDSLNKRGYRTEISEAPLKETMAAAIIMLSKWNDRFPLWDGFCGAGTIPIEAMMMAKNIAPGILRKFAYEAWENFPKDIVATEKREAKKAVVDSEAKITGSDMDKKIIDSAIRNAGRMGLEKYIDFRAVSVERFTPKDSNGFFISNLPYGKRMEIDAEIYKTLRDKFIFLKDWNFYLLTADINFEKSFLKSNGNRKMFNGRIEVRLYKYERRNLN
ncbi:THUMP domain-containing class I SAM-dependent RNA methyltransferase [Athalassotoga sp.]|uniref:THUMP domain-containing class I SAM-dependent RNA methyltransferase n=2 Tax=Athalassotoga sp. TaxID=2022597 RepID=UPI003D02D704